MAATQEMRMMGPMQTMMQEMPHMPAMAKKKDTPKKKGKKLKHQFMQGLPRSRR